MDEPSDDARAVIVSYRRARVLDADARARVHARLLSSTLDAEPAVPTPTRRWQLVTIAAIATATAAAVVLAAQLLWGTGMRLAEAPRNDAASHDLGPRERAPGAVRPATPPTSVSAPSDDDAPARVDAPPLQRGTIRSAADDTAAAATADALAAELAHMQAARAALARGDADTALRELAAHERSGAHAQLVEERQALRIDALCAAGKHPQARAEAKLFLRKYAASSHRARVEAACR